MMNYLRVLVACAALGLNSAAYANFNMSPSGTTTAFAIDGANQGTSLCAAASTECPASVPINTAGAPLFTSGVPGLVTLTGTNNINNIAGTISLPTGAATAALQATNTATTAHTCSVAGFSELGCLGQIDDDVKGNVPSPQTPSDWGIGSFAATAPAKGTGMGCLGSNVEQTAVTNGQQVQATCGLSGKLVVQLFSVKELAVRGNVTTTGSGAATIIAAGSGSNKTYVTDWECWNSSATTVTLTFNDSASTQIIVPAGGGNNKSLGVPLVTAAATAFTFTPSGAQTTIGCAAQAYYGL